MAFVIYTSIAALVFYGTRSHALTHTAQNASRVLQTNGFSQPTQHTSVGGLARCVSGIVQVSANTSDNVKFDFELPKNQWEVTQTWVNMWLPGSDFPNSITNGTLNVQGDYDIGATFCMPQGINTTKVQVLTHGIAFDRAYWDFAPGYSYVDVAIAAGYATLFYDRLGTGSSSKEDALNAIQAPLELAILDTLVQDLRRGALGSHKFSTVIGVGHSFGSTLTQGLSAANPQALDAVVLTGFSTNLSGMPAFSLGQNPTIAANNQPYRFGQLPPGYLVIGSPEALQTSFFNWPGFDPEILSLAYTTKATSTMAELFTSGLVIKPALNFHGPVAIVTGNEDGLFCNANCSHPNNLLAETVTTLYPNAPSNKTDTYRVPQTGHGINLHHSAKDAFEYIQRFLQQQGM